MNANHQELLNRRLDGELDAEQAARLELELHGNPQLRRELDRLRGLEQRMRSAFPADEGARAVELARDGRLELAIDRLSAALAERAVTNIVPLTRAAAPRQRNSAPAHWQRWAMAASVLTAAIGALVLYRALSPTAAFGPLALGGLASGHPVAAALERAPSGLTTPLDATGAEAGSIALLLSFRSHAGSVCREFELARAATAQVGVACRENERWIVRAVADSALPAADGAYRPAAADDPELIAKTVQSLMAGGLYSPEEEQRLIQSGWR